MIPTTDSAPQQAIVLLEPSNRQAFDRDRAELLAIAMPDEIVSPQEYEALVGDLDRVEQFTKRVKPAFDEVCDQAFKAHKAATTLRALFFDGLESFSKRARRLLGDYKEKQDRLRRAEERRLQEEERQRLVAQQQAEAKALEKQGHKEMAAAVRNTPVVAPAVALPTAVPTVNGLTYREEWRWRPIAGDSPEGRAAAVKVVPREYLQLNETALSACARGFKGIIRIPGIEFFKENVPVRR